MDLDNITDIEVLRETIRTHMVQVKKDFYSEDTKDRKYHFKKDHWYWVDFDYDWNEITVFSDDYEFIRTFKNLESIRYLYVE